MNSTATDWNTKLRQSFDHLPPSVISSLSNTFTRYTSYHRFYHCCLPGVDPNLPIRSESPSNLSNNRSKERYKKSKYPSYQNLLDIDNTQCQCFHISCLPKLQCVKATCQISPPSSDYARINERQKHFSCIRVHLLE